MMPWIQSGAAVIFTFGLVIFLHEFGHFILCRWFGVRVERFAFGFGPELLGFTKGETRYSICAFPLGGFVKPAGDNIEDCTGDPNEYFAKPWTQRLLIVAAGPSMNYVLAFVLFFLVVSFRGIPEPSKQAVIGDIAAGYPAEIAGLKVGDRVFKADGQNVASWVELSERIRRNPEKPLQLAFEREGLRMQATVVPRLDAATGHGLIGIRAKVEYQPAGLARAGREAAHQCWLWTAYTVKTLAEKIYKRERPDLAGPVGIVQMVHRAAHSDLEDFIFLIGLLSVAVGFFNILPVPLLDGGHAAMYVWEGLSRRKLTTQAMATVNSIGIVFLLSLLLFATYNDVTRIRAERRERRQRQEALQSAPATVAPAPVPGP
ncbi:MAG: site-2 protease family protein [Elusimicrobia bacterium]|nr:site-2 protease family protein [Elusimicrobiota bacterium]